MSSTKSSNKTHDANEAGYEATRQAAVVPSAAQTTVVSAEVTYFRACARSAIANGIQPGPYLNALRELGGTLYT